MPAKSKLLKAQKPTDLRDIFTSLDDNTKGVFMPNLTMKASAGSSQSVKKEEIVPDLIRRAI